MDSKGEREKWSRPTSLKEKEVEQCNSTNAGFFSRNEVVHCLLKRGIRSQEMDFKREREKWSRPLARKKNETKREERCLVWGG